MTIELQDDTPPSRRKPNKPAGAKRSRRAAPGDPDAVLEFAWTLDELPTSQHRAGLAGLVLMVRYLESREPRPPGAYTIDVEPGGARLRVDAKGLASMFDAAYGARMVERAQAKQRVNKKSKAVIAPIRTDVVTATDVKGKEATKTLYVYLDPEPAGAFLVDLDLSGGLWMKLWRDFIWDIVRAVPTTRGPYEDRAAGESTDDAATAWLELADPDRIAAQKGHLLFGAMEASAELVPFHDRARTQLLLHFWPFAVGVYQPTVEADDGKHKFTGYAVAIPDVRDLEGFCEELPDVLRQRDAEKQGYRPRGAVVDVAAESGLAFMAGIVRRIADREGRRRSVSSLLHGIDVVYLERPGRSVAIRGLARIDPALDASLYSRIRETFRDRLFRRLLIANLLDGRRWHYGFDRLFRTTSHGRVVGNPWFGQDARTAFDFYREESMESTTDGKQPRSLDILIFELVRAYLGRRVAGKHGLTWDGEDKQGFAEARERLARDAFLAIRARVGPDFVDYFAATLASVPQFLRSEEFVVLADGLRSRTDEVRTLTMLALSAHSYGAKRPDKEIAR